MYKAYLGRVYLLKIVRVFSLFRVNMSGFGIAEIAVLTRLRYCTSGFPRLSRRVVRSQQVDKSLMVRYNFSSAQPYP